MTFRLNTRSYLFALLFTFAIVAVACGGGGDDEASPTATPVSGGETQVANLTGSAATGEQLFGSEGCSACHRTNSDRLVGPGLAGISDRGDDDYIRESLTDPAAVLVEGYPNVMTRFDHLSDQELEDLVAYLNTLD